MSSRVPLTLACWDYDRTQALRDGTVRPDGIDLTYLSLPVEETFFRMAHYREFDASEMSLSSYVLSLSRGAPFVAIPVFPSRAFRHNAIYVNAEAGIDTPAELSGRLVGVPEYQVTANVWIRGILAEYHDLPVSAVRYRAGGMHTPGRVEKIALSLPDEIDIAPIPDGSTLADLLVTGEIDALYAPRTPRPFAQGDPRVRRLFTDPRTAEQAYYRQTGIFPVMHVVVLRRDVYESNRWVARSLFKAFEAAKRATEQRIGEVAASQAMLPWLYAELESTRAVMGEDYWTYGLTEANAHTLRTFLRYSHDQSLADRLYDPEELFAPETLESYVI